MTEGTCNVLRTFREVDVSPVSPNSTTRIRGRKTEDKNELTVWARFAFIEFQIIRTANDFRTVY